MDVSVPARAREEEPSETRHPSRSMYGLYLFLFISLLFCFALVSFDRALMVVAYWCRLGSDAGRSVSPYPGSENGNVSDHNAPPPPPGPKKKGRPPKNKPRGAAYVFCVVAHRRVESPLLSSAPVQAASSAASVINDEDALSNRKRVR